MGRLAFDCSPKYNLIAVILCNTLKYHLFELICFMNIMIKSTDFDRIYLTIHERVEFLAQMIDKHIYQ